MIKLEHEKIHYIKENINFKEIKSLEEYINHVYVEGKEINPDDNAINKFCGDCTELLIEYFNKKNPDALGIYDYSPEPSKDDVGVDATGDGRNGEKLAIQIKYIADPSKQLEYNFHKFGNFIAKAVKKEEEGGKGIPTCKNLRFITTVGNTNEISDTIRNEYLQPGGKIIGRDELGHYMKGVEFWKGFQECIDSQKREERPEPLERMEHQIRVSKEIDKFLRDEMRERGYVISPTSSGKTLMMSDAIRLFYLLCPDGLVILSMPRVKLCNQNKKAINEDFPGQYISFHTKGEECPPYKGESIYNGDCNTNIEALRKEIEKADKPVIITTPHSTKKLGEVVNELGKPILYICDECHNLVSVTFGEILSLVDPWIKFQKFIGFTGTGVQTRDSLYGMNNEQWGGPIEEISYLEMIKRGIILPPLIARFDSDDPSRAENLVSCGVKCLQEDIESRGLKLEHIKLIIKCKSREQAKNLYSSAKLDSFENFEMYSSDDTIQCHDDPHKQLDKFRKHEGNALLFFVDMISEGIDVDDISGVLFTTPCSLKDALQIIGRALRRSRLDKNRTEKDAYEFDRWHKPYGYVLIPNHAHEDSSYSYEAIVDKIEEIRGENSPVNDLEKENTKKAGSGKIIIKDVTEKDIKQKDGWVEVENESSLKKAEREEDEQSQGIEDIEIYNEIFKYNTN